MHYDSTQSMQYNVGLVHGRRLGHYALGTRCRISFALSTVRKYASRPVDYVRGYVAGAQQGANGSELDTEV